MGGLWVRLRSKPSSSACGSSRATLRSQALDPQATSAILKGISTFANIMVNIIERKFFI